jgi:hypothetical protein
MAERVSEIIDDSRDGNNATDKQREGAYAFYLAQFHADIINKGGRQ